MTDVEIQPTTNGAPKVVSERARHDLDVIVIGSGPGGQRAAIQAAKLGKRVAVVERRERVGGVSIHTGTVPSKTLRQAILEDIANRGKDVPDPLHPELRERAAVEYLRDRTARVVAQETAIIREQFRRNSVGLIIGDAEFLDPNTIRITDDIATTPDQIVTADHVVLAVGTRPARPQGVDFDERRVIDSDGILRLEEAVPRTMTVVGAGVIGVEYASMFAAMGTRVTLVDARSTLLPFIDREIADRAALPPAAPQRVVPLRRGGRRRRSRGRARAHAAEVRQDDPVAHADVRDRPAGRDGAPQARARGAHVRQARAHRGRRRLPHDACPTSSPWATSPARRASRRPAWSRAGSPLRAYVVGVAWWRELAKALMIGEEDGMLKILVSPEDRRLLGVHVIGSQATDLVHKVAGLDAQNRLRDLC